MNRHFRDKENRKDAGKSAKLPVTTKGGKQDRYSFENAVKFWRSHRVDLSSFRFDRIEANL
jgi:hypothetical protein